MKSKTEFKLLSFGSHV